MTILNMLDYVRTRLFHCFAVVLRSTLALIADQLIGIARGLHHLHSDELIHGDLKGVSKAFT